ncbi:hypothetical protein, partial [Rothia sp. (in: high G+C Gram-positive bacteria)]
LFNCNSEYHLSPTRRTIFYISDSPAEITLQTGMQIKKRIPFGSKLFDPDSWDEEKQEYTRVSASAKPLDNLDEAEENKSEQ